MAISHRSNGGFTLIELMVAMVITLVSLLGLLQAINLMTVQNLSNATRDEALQVAEEKMNELRTRPFSLISTVPNRALYPGIDSTTHQWPPDAVRSRLRGVNTNYTVLKSAQSISSASTLLQVAVRWKFKNASTTQGLQSIRSDDVL
jgi:type IV pilus assembly protein PilV